MAIAAVPIVLLALLAILLWYASAIMVRWLSSAVPDWGIPGLGNLRSYIQGTATFVIETTADWLHSIMAPIQAAMAGPVIAVYNSFLSAKGVMNEIILGVQWLKSTYIPSILSQAMGYSYGLYNLGNQYAAALYGFAATGIDDARAYAVALSQTAYTQAVGAATGLVNDARAYAVALSQTAYTQAVGTATGLVNAARAETTDLFRTASAATAALEARTLGLFATAQSDIAAGVAAAEAYALSTAVAVTGAAVTDIDHAVNAALAGIWTDVDIAIEQTIGVIGADDPDILAAIRAIPRAIPTDIAGVATLAGVTTLALTRYLKDCGIPNCRNLHGFGDELQGLLGIVGDASFFALLATLIHSPGSAAEIVDDTFGAGIRAATTLTRSVFGV